MRAHAFSRNQYKIQTLHCFILKRQPGQTEQTDYALLQTIKLQFALNLGNCCGVSLLSRGIHCCRLQKIAFKFGDRNFVSLTCQFPPRHAYDINTKFPTNSVPHTHTYSFVTSEIKGRPVAKVQNLFIHSHSLFLFLTKCLTGGNCLYTLPSKTQQLNSRLATSLSSILHTVNIILIYKHYIHIMSNPLPLRSKAYVCSRPVPGIAGSKPAENMDVLLCLLWVVQGAASATS